MRVFVLLAVVSVVLIGGCATRSYDEIVISNRSTKAVRIAVAPPASTTSRGIVANRTVYLVRIGSMEEWRLPEKGGGDQSLRMPVSVLNPSLILSVSARSGDEKIVRSWYVDASRRMAIVIERDGDVVHVTSSPHEARPSSGPDTNVEEVTACLR